MLLVSHARDWLLLYPAQAQSDAVQSMLEARLLDSDEQVRAACVAGLGDAALERADALPAPLVLALENDFVACAALLRAHGAPE